MSSPYFSQNWFECFSVSYCRSTRGRPWFSWEVQLRFKWSYRRGRSQWLLRFFYGICICCFFCWLFLFLFWFVCFVFYFVKLKRSKGCLLNYLFNIHWCGFFIWPVRYFPFLMFSDVVFYFILLNNLEKNMFWLILCFFMILHVTNHLY